ncbi:uncharacterized protein F4812DRAFT_425377 [Daldinia caldariorum]|uniref:uncharacterized protein n=1 Tax=Daldinia caldariorum TaxID=326644 RepID=UPI00200759C4|nr:uncharacterized protein F4812DRAFT_425377 [Daldinia caldariorum]KAI1468987.1 hypothetical protein F4812DRAFT_425377 [Daldinia caldariorum]
MAEVAAGILAAEQAVSATIYAGAAGYALAKSTMPLKATFSQTGYTPDTASSASLTRSHHTLTIIGDKAYIFGGQTGQGKLAGNSIHSIALPEADTATPDTATPEYQVLPALAAEKGGSVPKPRTRHSACVLNNSVAIYGGYNESGNIVDEDSTIWLFDVEKLTWSTIKPYSLPESTPPPRGEAYLLAHDGNLILVGGKNANGEALTDVWHYNCSSGAWKKLSHTPDIIAGAAIAGHTLYAITNSDDSLGSEVHRLDIQPYTGPWQTVSFPTDPLTPGPRPRSRGGLIPITTGYGRNYLVYFFGDRKGKAEAGDLLQWSDLWTFQLPSSDLEAKSTTSVKDAIKPAKIKDEIRKKLGADTGGFSWAEVEVQPPGDIEAHEGKIHPGPRGSFGYDVTNDGKRIVLWGGCNAAGEPEGDGWIVEFS